MIRKFSYSKFLNLETVLWFNPLWKIPQHLPNVLEKLSEVGHIAMKFETARIHFLRAEVQLAASLSINTLRKLHRRARTLVIIPEKV